MSANNLLKKKSVIYDKDAGGVYKKKLRKIFTSNDPEMNPHHFDPSSISESFSALLMDAASHQQQQHQQQVSSNNNNHGSGHEQGHHDITVKPFYNIGEIVNFRERSQTVDQIGFVYHKKASSLHEKERIPKCVVYMLTDEKYWVLEWLLMKENNIEAGERTFESSEKSSPPPQPTNNNSLPNNNNTNISNNQVNGMTTSKSNANLSIVPNQPQNLMGTNNNMDIGTSNTNVASLLQSQNGSLNNPLITSRFGHHHTQNGNLPNGFLNSNGHYHGITKSNKTSSGSVQLSQHLSSLLSSIDSQSKFPNNSTPFDKMDDEETLANSEKRSTTLNDPFSSSSNQIPSQSDPSLATRLSNHNRNAFHSSNSTPPNQQQQSSLSSEVKELLLGHPLLSQKNNSTSNSSALSSRNIPQQHSGGLSTSSSNISNCASVNNPSSSGIGSGNNSSNTSSNNNMEKLAQQSQFNLFAATGGNGSGVSDGSMMSSGNGLHHPMNSMRRIPSNGSIAMGSMNQLFTSDVNDATSQLKKQMVLNHIQQRQQLVNQQLMELLNQQNRRATSNSSIPSSKYDLNLLNIASNYQYNITPSYGPHSQPAIVSFNHNFELRPTDMLQFLVIQVKDGQNLKAFCVNPVISYDNDTLIALNDLSNRVALSSNGNIPNLDEELAKFVHSSPLLVTLPPQEEPSSALIVLMKNFIPITSPLLFEYTP